MTEQKTSSIASGLQTQRRVAPTALLGSGPTVGTTPAAVKPAVDPSNPPIKLADGTVKLMSECTMAELQAFLAAGGKLGGPAKTPGKGGLSFSRAEQRLSWLKTEGRSEEHVAAKGDQKAYIKKAKPPCYGLVIQPDNRGNALQLTVSPGGGLSIGGAGPRGVHGSAAAFLGLISEPLAVVEFFERNRETCIEQAITAASEAEAAKEAAGKGKAKTAEVIRNEVVKSFDGALSDAKARLAAQNIGTPAPAAQ